MADETNVADVWQQQPSEGFRLTGEEITMKIEELDRKLRRRTHDGYLVCGFLMLAFTVWALLESDPFLRLGAAATVAAVAYLAFQVHRNRFRKQPPVSGATPSLDHLRTELARQRDFHRGNLFWSRMLLLAPAGLLFFFGFGRAHPEVLEMIRWEVASFVVLVLAAIPLNRRMAARYEREIEELDAA